MGEQATLAKAVPLSQLQTVAIVSMRAVLVSGYLANFDSLSLKASTQKANLAGPCFPNAYYPYLL